ncbi:hypothetical protein TNCV_2980711 [Trichonephila clavipes]|nr:hypothetical protein TNCV_2980711 [Trichonephila clavipes]
MNHQIEHLLANSVFVELIKKLCNGRTLNVSHEERERERQTTGSELLSSLIHLCNAGSLNMNNCVSITTDGAKSMIGTKIGMVKLLKECLSHCGVELLQTHSFTHQENLCGKELGFCNLNAVCICSN